MQVDSEERVLMSKDEILNKITTLTGGRAAEDLIFKSATSGASNDIEQATKLARTMISRYGMSEKFGMVALESVNNPYLSQDTSLTCSAQTASEIDAEVIETIQEAYNRAYKILEENTEKLHELSEFLLQNETITGTEFMQILEK